MNGRSPNDAAQRRFIFGALSPLVVYLAVFSLLPIVWAVTLSFFDYSARRDGSSIGGLGGDNPFIGLANYRQMFDFSDTAPKEVGDFRNGLKVTALFTVLVVPLNLLITLPLAALIESVHRRMRPVFRTIFFLPVLTSAVAVAIMWQFILDPQRGLLSGALSKITGEPVVEGWISDPNLDFLGLARLVAVRRRRLPLAGHRLQPRDLHRRPAGDPTVADERCRRRRRKLVADLPQGHACRCSSRRSCSPRCSRRSGRSRCSSCSR